MIENMTTAGLLAITLLVVTPIYLVLQTIYRLTLHPLAKYPGPLLSKISGWVTPVQAVSGDRHLKLYQDHEKYGPIVRTGPNEISINTTAALREIYVSRKANVEKGEWYKSLTAGTGAPSTHSETSIPRHATRRRVLDHAFSDSALRSAEGFIITNVRRWSARLGGETKNMATWATYLAWDVMGDLTFGHPFNLMDDEQQRHVPRLLLEGAKFMYMFGYMPVAWLFRPLLGTWVMDILGGQMARDNQAYSNYAQKQITERLKAIQDSEKTETKSRKDFAYYLYEARDPDTGRGFTPQELHAESGLLIGAGADTTSIVMAAGFFYLVRYPGVLAKVADEVRSTFQSVDQITGNAVLKSLPYLSAVIDETLRMAPPVPGHLPRKVLPGGLDIEGEHFPEGTTVGTGVYAIHHNEEYFPDAFVFRPERWIRGSMPGVTQESVDTARAAFCPFSLGIRGCIGKRVAYLEMHLAFATALFQYDAKRSPSDPTGGGDATKGRGRERTEEYQLSDGFICDRDGPMVDFKPRQALAT